MVRDACEEGCDIEAVAEYDGIVPEGEELSTESVDSVRLSVADAVGTDWETNEEP